MVPIHGAQNPATVAALAGRVSTGGAVGGEGSFAGWQGHVSRLLHCVHVRGCGCVRLWLEPLLGSRCTPILHVAVPRGGRVAQPWAWGGSVHVPACLSERTESARARRMSEIWARVVWHHVGYASVTVTG